MIDIFLTILEEKNVLGSIFNSKGELIRASITYNKILNNNIIISNKIPNGNDIRGRIPIGNTFYPDGEWKKYHIEKETIRYFFLEKIHEKVNKLFTKREIVDNFDVFYKAYKYDLLNNSITTIQQIKELNLITQRRKK